ncbi:MAG: hypothetical protein M1825_004647 [Sarcosagium campestre]|nr:MAG: hypothetical protein M1825_004647 [Sarcosagium campestre]
MDLLRRQRGNAPDDSKTPLEPEQDDSQSSSHNQGLPPPVPLNMKMSSFIGDELNPADATGRHISVKTLNSGASSPPMTASFGRTVVTSFRPIMTDPADSTPTDRVPTDQPAPPAPSGLPPGKLFAAIFFPIFFFGLATIGAALLIRRHRKRRAQQSRELKALPSPTVNAGSNAPSRSQFLLPTQQPPYEYHGPSLDGPVHEYYGGIPNSVAAANGLSYADPNDQPPPYRQQASPIPRVPVDSAPLSRSNLERHSMAITPPTASSLRPPQNPDTFDDRVSDISADDLPRGPPVAAARIRVDDDAVSVVSDLSDVGARRQPDAHSPV